MSLPLFGQILTTAAPIVMGAISSSQANKAAKDEKEEKRRLQKLLTSLESSRQPLVNPYENLSVATKAAEMKIEQTDIALANTLDTLRATGAGAGGATALAQAAAQSKAGVAASIETQEAANEQLKAKGEQFLWQARETRELQKLDRTAGLLERSQAQEMQYKQDARSAMMGGVMGAAQIASVMPWGGKSGTTKDKTIDTNNLNGDSAVDLNYNFGQTMGTGGLGSGLNLGGFGNTGTIGSGLNLGGLGVGLNNYNQGHWDIGLQRWVND